MAMKEKSKMSNSKSVNKKNKGNTILSVHMFVLGLAFVYSMDLTWELISLISAQKYYLPLQFLCSSFYALYSLMVTKDVLISQEYWKKHPRMEKILEGILHFCTVFIVKLPVFLIGIPDVLFGGKSRAVVQQEKKDTEEQIKKIDDMPLTARCIMLPSFICLVWIIGQNFWTLGDDIDSWISKGLDFLVSLMGVFLLKVAVKESIIEKEKLEGLEQGK